MPIQNTDTINPVYQKLFFLKKIKPRELEVLNSEAFLGCTNKYVL